MVMSDELATRRLIPQHSSASVEHFTPPHIVEAARAAMGSIDFDPASCDAANGIVRASLFMIDPGADQLGFGGLAAEWRGNVFCNPPGGRTTPEVKQRYRTNSNAVAWWRKAVDEYWRGPFDTQIVFVGFSIELLQAAQGCPGWQTPLDFPICVPTKRLQFSGARQPTHANVIVYLGNQPGKVRFYSAFRGIGDVRL